LECHPNRIIEILFQFIASALGFVFEGHSLSSPAMTGEGASSHQNMAAERAALMSGGAAILS
jgi:hypothetical protein